MSAHTPGPWRPEFGNNKAWVIAGIEHCVAEVPVLRSTNPEINQNIGVMNANAKLIAAAPDLLEACRRIAADGYGTAIGDLEFLKRAIAKAQGK